jgi:hypothetical protein
MEPNTPNANAPNVISRAGTRADNAAMQATEGMAKAGAGAGGLLDKFNAMPVAGKAIVAFGALAMVWLMFGGGGSPTTQATRGPTNVGQVGGQTASPTTSFGTLESDRPALIQNVFEQNRRDMAELRLRMEEQFSQRDTALQSALQQNQELQTQMQQMMGDFTAEIKAMQESREQDAARLAQLADQQQQLEMGSSVGDASAQSPVMARRRPIGQTSLGAPPMGMGNGGILGPLAPGVGGNLRNNTADSQKEPERKPFIPPLGFVEATLINGVDALVGSGGGTPALARINGNYTTAMNSTVYLDGCVVMLEFVGNISTERATGKPMRMTCVYPDGGAATYSLSGYVVDAEDGVIGVPGLLYEGDPTRIASSIVADFLAGIGEIASENNTTTRTNTDGTTTNSRVTSDDFENELAGGVNKAFGSIRDYLKERVDRTTPFIRLDALRTVNLVLLSGQELRADANPWTLLFDASRDGGTTPEATEPQPNQPQQGAP